MGTYKVAPPEVSLSATNLIAKSQSMKQNHALPPTADRHASSADSPVSGGPPRRGGVAATPIRFREATSIGADGVVSSAKTRPCRSFIDASPYRARASRHPACAASVAPRHLLMAQPPLLCEGNNILESPSEGVIV